MKNQLEKDIKNLETFDRSTLLNYAKTLLILLDAKEMKE